MNPDRLKKSLTPKLRAEMSAVIQGDEDRGSTVIYDWLQDRGVVDTLADIVRIYVPDPELELPDVDSVNWDLMMKECYDDAGRRAIASQFGNKPWQFSNVEFPREQVEKYTARRLVMNVGLAHRFLCVALRNYGYQEQADSIEDYVARHIDTTRPALSPNALSLAIIYPNSMWRRHSWDKEPSECSHPEQDGYEGAIYWFASWVIAKDDHGNDVRVKIRMGRCQTCGVIHWSAPENEPLAQPDVRRGVLAMDFFETHPDFLKINRCAMTRKEFIGAGSESRAARLWSDLLRDTRFFPPQRPQAEPRARYDELREIAECVQELRPLDWLQPSGLPDPASGNGSSSPATFSGSPATFSGMDITQRMFRDRLGRFLPRRALITGTTI